MTTQNSTLITKHRHEKERGKEADICQKCKSLHSDRVKKLDRGDSANEEVKKIRELTEKYCTNSGCELNPLTLWENHSKLPSVICAYCSSDPCVCDAWTPK